MIRSFNNCRRSHNHLRRFQNESGSIRATTAAVASMSMSMPISKQATNQSSSIQSPSIQSRGYRNLASRTSMNNNSNLKLSTWLQQQQQHYLNRQQIRTVFIQTENTPNPESIKFMPTNTVRKKML
jgi:hypothetical protein